MECEVGMRRIMGEWEDGKWWEDVGQVERFVSRQIFTPRKLIEINNK